jgi:hypothetical protein
MGFKLHKTSTVLRDVPLVQFDENGKEHAARLKVRFNIISREKWDALVKSSDDDDRLLYDVVVAGIADQVDGPDGAPLSAEDALASFRSDMSLTGQIVDYWTGFAFGAAAKNAQRSRAR